MNVLSLFDGISCGQLALEKMLIKVDKYYSSEKEENCIKITNKNFPNTIQLGDVIELTSDKLEELPKIDLLIGGSPCKNLSIAVINNIEHNQGLDGIKSKLFYEYVRIFKWLTKNNNPDLKFLLENVASMQDKDRDIISDVMGIEPIMIDSADYSAQNRKRYYWTNIDFELNEDKDTTVLRDVILDLDEIGNQPNGRMKVWYKQDFEMVNTNGNVIGILDINGHDILKRLYSLDKKCATLTTCGGGNRQKKIIQNGVARKLLPIEYERLQTVPDNYTKGVSNTARYNMLGNGWTVDVLVDIFSGLTN